MKRLVILGGGYGGIRIIQSLLSTHLPDDVELILIDRQPFQGLKTEFYALAAGTESEVNIRKAFPVNDRLKLIYGEIINIDLDKRTIIIKDYDPVHYDEVVIALGCTDNYHNIQGAKENSLSIQSLASTRHAYQQINNVQPYGTVNIVGGGLSGVELAAELREARADLNIQIIDRGASPLSSFPNRLQKYVSTWFINNDVLLLSNSSINEVHSDHLLVNQNKEVKSDCTIWTAGIKANPLVEHLPVEKDTIGRLLITRHHHLDKYPEVFVVGDCASLPFPPSAQLAESQGEQVVQVLQNRWQGIETGELPKIKLKGVLGSLGKKHGFGMMGTTSIVGRIPRILKSGVLWISKYHNG